MLFVDHPMARGALEGSPGKVPNRCHVLAVGAFNGATVAPRPCVTVDRVSHWREPQQSRR